MSTLAELILERDKERGRRRSRSTTPRTSDAVAAQNQPALQYRLRGSPPFARLRRCFLLGVPHWVRHRRRALHTGQNPGFQYAHYLWMAQ